MATGTAEERLQWPYSNLRQSHSGNKKGTKKVSWYIIQIVFPCTNVTKNERIGGGGRGCFLITLRSPTFIPASILAAFLSISRTMCLSALSQTLLSLQTINKWVSETRKWPVSKGWHGNLRPIETHSARGFVLSVAFQVALSPIWWEACSPYFRSVLICCI